MIFRIKCTIVGSGIDYKKRVEDISETDRLFIKLHCENPNVIFYARANKTHYTQSGYKVITYNPDRYEYYHREPTPAQLKQIKKGEKK